MYTIKHLFLVSAVAALAACGGGGEEGDLGRTFQRHDVSPAETISVKAGTYVALAVDSQTLGPALASQTWKAVPVGATDGEIEFTDSACEDATKSSRDVPGSDKVVSTWHCETSVRAAAGSKGQFRIINTAIDAEGNSEQDDVLLVVTP